METITLRGCPTAQVASPGKTITPPRIDVPVRLTVGAETRNVNIGRLAIDNELVRFKYGV